MFSEDEKRQSEETTRSQDNSRHHRGRKKELESDNWNNDFFLAPFRAPALPKSRNWEYYVTELFYKWPSPNVSGFITQLVRASHRYREVTGSNPVEVLTFSGLYIRNCINCVHNCEDHSLLELFHRSAALPLSHPIFSQASPSLPSPPLP